jgi:hypothetical protein
MQLVQWGEICGVANEVTSQKCAILGQINNMNIK